MARMSQAEWLGEHSPKTPMSRYDIVCVHTIVGFAPAHAAHFSTHQGGTIQQSRDTRYRSAANLDGNHRVIAIENEDHGSAFPDWNVTDGHAVPALTDDQVEANARIFAWAHLEHGIPLQLCPDSKPGSRGLAYHRQGIDGNWSGYKYGGRVSGGEEWSEHFGKVCPGDRRIDQVPQILARAKQIVSGEDDDMAVSNEDADKIADRTLSKILFYRNPYGQQVPGHDTQSPTLAQSWGRTDKRTYDGRSEFEKILANQQAIMDAQEGLDTPAVLERIDQRHTEAAQQRQVIAETMTARLDGVAALLQDHADGNLDERQVVEGIRALLHEATAPTDQTP